MKEAIAKMRKWFSDHAALIETNTKVYSSEAWLLEVFGEDAREITLQVDDTEIKLNCTEPS